MRSLWMAERVLVLHGPSAVGKTSLLNAGVLPLLAQESDVDVWPVGRLALQAARPLAEAPPHNGYSFSLINSWNQAGRAVWPGLTIAEFFSSAPARTNQFGDPRNMLVAIDQFEELFTSFPARYSEREGFLAELSEALSALPALRLMLVIRDDHLAAVRALERRLPYPTTYVRLEALGAESAALAVVKPFEVAGRSFAPGVAGELVDLLRATTYTDQVGESVTLRGDFVEPLLLQIVCFQLWSSLPDELAILRSEDVHMFGDVDQATVRFYDSAVREVQNEADESEERLRSWIESVFITENGTRGNAYRGINSTSDMSNKVVDAFAARHILSPEWRSMGIWYELSQDRLIAAIRQSNAAWRVRNDRAVLTPVPVVASPASFRAAAEEAFGLGNYPSARRFAQAAESRYRDSGDSRRLAQTLVLSGDISRAEGDLNGARESLRKALRSFAVLDDSVATTRTLSALADVSMSAGDYAAAEDLQGQALQKRPSDVEARIGLGYAQWYQGSSADAEATFNGAIESQPDSGRALAARGQVRVQLREYEAALEDLDLALAKGVVFADEVDSRSARALALAGLGRAGEAERELAAARLLDPQRAAPTCAPD